MKHVQSNAGRGSGIHSGAPPLGVSSRSQSTVLKQGTPHALGAGWGTRRVGAPYSKTLAYPFTGTKKQAILGLRSLRLLGHPTLKCFSQKKKKRDKTFDSGACCFHKYVDIHRRAIA